ncbi:MAG: hypothetical protein O3A60_06900 [Planctomycetota bacterium]|nr:hypothetical protein [Planctomycetota bacterium]
MSHRRGGIRHTGWLAATLLAVGLGSCLPTGSLRAAERPDPEIRTVETGSSSRAARQEALTALSTVMLPREQAKLVRECVGSTTLYRRLPTKEFECHPDMLLFALEHPEGVVDIWRVLDISRLTLDPAGPEQWRLADGYGTVGTMRMLHRSGDANQGMLVLHGRGGYAGPFAHKPLTGNCVVLLRYHYEGSPGQPGHRVCLKTDAFLDVDGLGFEIVTRTLQPLIVSTAGWNVHEICLFMGHLSRTAAENPLGVERLSQRLTQIAPEHRRQLAAAARRAAGGGGAVEQEPEIASRLASRWMSNDLPEERTATPTQ